MVKTAEAARGFAGESRPARPGGGAEFGDLLAELRTIDPAERVEAWQSRYLPSGQAPQARLRLPVRPTSPTPGARWDPGHHRALFGVRIGQGVGSPWHEAVECFDVFEGDRASRASIDMFPREDSSTPRCSRCAAAWRGRLRAALVCNFPSPRRATPRSAARPGDDVLPRGRASPPPPVLDAPLPRLRGDRL